MSLLNARDYRLLFDLSLLVHDGAPGMDALALLGTHLSTLMSATNAIYVDMDWERGRADARQWPHVRDALGAELGRVWAYEHPLMTAQRAGDLSPTTVDRAVHDRRVWRRSDLYIATKEAVGVTAQLSLPLYSSQARTITLAFGRDGRDFGQRDLEICRTVQPLAARAAELSAAASCVTQPLAPGRPGSGGPAPGFLTRREEEVLRCLAAGLTATGIGSRLGVSPRTVHKHLDHIYRKLGVRDRLSAVLVANDAGVLPGVPRPRDRVVPL